MLSILLAQAISNAPVASPAAEPFPPPDLSRLSLVVADTVSETDPKPLCSRPDCTSLFLGRYRDATVLSGLPLPADFTARVEMGPPWNMSYRIVLIVEHRDGDEPLVRAMGGYNARTGEACLELPRGSLREWRPEGRGISTRPAELCVATTS